ncbi:MAG TPA: DinB family protein [Candidatus Acidoferrales bacterium]|nr:DinB family protein [Candidatus Acidoferrales bacterium]
MATPATIGRPEQNEAAPYYFTYINQVDGDDILHIIEVQLDETLAFCSRIPEEKSLYRYAPEKWSIRQVLNHLTDTERSFAFRVLWFARGFDAPLPSYDQNIAAASADADKIPWAAHIEEFRCVRLATISLFANMPADAWNRSGIASEKRFTVRALAYIIAGHVTHHLKILGERYMPETR